MTPLQGKCHLCPTTISALACSDICDRCNLGSCRSHGVKCIQCREFVCLDCQDKLRNAQLCSTECRKALDTQDMITGSNTRCIRCNKPFVFSGVSLGTVCRECMLP